MGWNENGRLGKGKGEKSREYDVEIMGRDGDRMGGNEM